MSNQIEEIAKKMGKDHREISVSEFFEKNRHLLGYDNKVKALLTVVRECVDNSLDACEEARILPLIYVEVKQIKNTEDMFKVIVKDNGPGIVKSNITRAFGKLLYGSKFDKLKQNRGQQGIGVSGAVLYAQLTSGKPAKVTSSSGDGKVNYYELMIDTIKNEPEIISEETKTGDKNEHGITTEMVVQGKYVEHKQSILRYLRDTAIANPYAKIVFSGPGRKIIFNRGTKSLPPLANPIKPHPHGVEIGVLKKMVKLTKARTLKAFLVGDFTRVGSTSAKQICKLAKLNLNVKPSMLSNEEVNDLYNAIQKVKLIKPPTNCLSPLGEKLIKSGLEKELNPEYTVAITRPPSVYRGNPFCVEVGFAYGGELKEGVHARLFRFANKVPLLYQVGDCAITKAVGEVEWRRYGLEQPMKSVLPFGPLAIFVHLCSVWVPFTSESKEAIASYPDVIKEIKLALQDAGRAIASYIRKKRKAHREQERASLFEKYIPEVAESLSKLTRVEKEKIIKGLETFLKKGNIAEIEEEYVEKIKDTKEPEAAKDKKTKTTLEEYFNGD